MDNKDTNQTTSISGLNAYDYLRSFINEATRLTPEEMEVYKKAHNTHKRDEPDYRKVVGILMDSTLSNMEKIDWQTINASITHSLEDEKFKRNTNIILVDKNPQHIKTISESLKIFGMFNVINATKSANEAVTLVNKFEPEILIIDIDCDDSFESLEKIEKLNKKTKIIVLSNSSDEENIYHAMKVGVKSYILKTMSTEQLIYAVDKVEEGKIFLPNGLSTKFFKRFKKSVNCEVNVKTVLQDALHDCCKIDFIEDKLTTKENDTLNLLLRGFNYTECAEQLKISETTIKTHVNNIFSKKQVHSLQQLLVKELSKNKVTNNDFKVFGGNEVKLTGLMKDSLSLLQNFI